MKSKETDEEYKKRRARYSAEWRKNHPGYYAEYQAKYRKENKERLKLLKAERYQATKDKVLIAVKKWAQENKHKTRASVMKWMKNNRAKVNAYWAKRYAAKRQAIPKWVDLSAIADVYVEAEYMQMHVDHIVPLVSEKVCGLHVWDNLQLLTPFENISKGNRYWPDMPDKDISGVLA